MKNQIDSYKQKKYRKQLRKRKRSTDKQNDVKVRQYTKTSEITMTGEFPIQREANEAEFLNQTFLPLQELNQSEVQKQILSQSKEL